MKQILPFPPRDPLSRMNSPAALRSGKGLRCRALILFLALLLSPKAWAIQENASTVEVLAGTAPLTLEGDLAAEMVWGVDRFLLQQIEQSSTRRDTVWTLEPWTESGWQERRQLMWEKLRHMLGIRDPRVAYDAPQVIGPANESTILAEHPSFRVWEISWPTTDWLTADGLLLEPYDREPLGTIIAIPDADIPPEAIALGRLEEGVTTPFAAQLAEAGFRVVVPRLVSRNMSRRNDRALMSDREYIYRSAFELGRHVIGYELQSILAIVDWVERSNDEQTLCVVGAGEGGMLAGYAAALDERIDGVVVSGYFTERENLWREPVERNVFGILDGFGDAELGLLISPRAMVVDVARVPEADFPSQGGAPGVLRAPGREPSRREFDRMLMLLERQHQTTDRVKLVVGADSSVGVSRAAINELLKMMELDLEVGEFTNRSMTVFREPNVNEKNQALLERLDRYSQWLLSESPYVRAEFMSRLDTSSLAAFEQSQTAYRELFAEEIIGSFDLERQPFRPRTRLAYTEATWSGYEVVLDVFPDVMAYGILLVPADIEEGEQRPVVVCQHGLEGRPQDVVAGDHRAYHDFAAKLAERGFVVFAPQNICIFEDRFRTLQRKANPLKKTLFSIMVPQHQQIVDWLQTLAFVDSQRIAFYGLSYGGKSAMRIPALVEDYCLSICSADFNDWVWKNASTRSRYSYVWTGEYEIFEFDLGSTFNYSEMAALIAPRPFMVERGHFDGVAPDERVAYEFAKVRHLYAAKLRIPDRCEIEWFVGPHTINGVGTFEFLHRCLQWPLP